MKESKKERRHQIHISGANKRADVWRRGRMANPLVTILQLSLSLSFSITLVLNHSCLFVCFWLLFCNSHSHSRSQSLLFSITLAYLFVFIALLFLLLFACLLCFVFISLMGCTWSAISRPFAAAVAQCGYKAPSLQAQQRITQTLSPEATVQVHPWHSKIACRVASAMAASLHASVTSPSTPTVSNDSADTPFKPIDMYSTVQPQRDYARQANIYMQHVQPLFVHSLILSTPQLTVSQPYLCIDDPILQLSSTSAGSNNQSRLPRVRAVSDLLYSNITPSSRVASPFHLERQHAPYRRCRRATVSGSQ
ncbi:hypothetical protein GQ42DRAFT_54534 [Ramicandelaber brevisporus]|nr:hypothetical protein GQ42DRAFT_54534 [Ramicandelaber brevisporus]